MKTPSESTTIRTAKAFKWAGAVVAALTFLQVNLSLLHLDPIVQDRLDLALGAALAFLVSGWVMEELRYRTDEPVARKR